MEVQVLLVSCSFSKFVLFMDTLYNIFLSTAGLLSSCLAQGNMRGGTRRIGCVSYHLNTLRTGDADLRLYITTVQDG